MSTQPDLFRPMCAKQSSRQGELFPAGLDEVSSLRCGECHADMIRTPSGWLACPLGHGKLTCEAAPAEEMDEEAWIHWFNDDQDAQQEWHQRSFPDVP